MFKRTKNPQYKNFRGNRSTLTQFFGYVADSAYVSFQEEIGVRWLVRKLDAVPTRLSLKLSNENARGVAS